MLFRSPTLIEETDKIMCAQKARGADFESGSLMDRAKALIPILVPLFISSFRRADELAVAMECRCYHGGDGRTRMKQLRYGRNDFVALAGGCVILAISPVRTNFFGSLSINSSAGNMCGSAFRSEVLS